MYLKEMRPDQVRQAVENGVPLLVPAGCIENHGPHQALGLDTMAAEEICRRLAQRMEIVIAPSFEYGATGYAVSGPEGATIDIDNVAFEAYAKSVLRAFWQIGFRRIAVIVHHQGMDGPLALAFRKAQSELIFELMREKHGVAWWGGVPPAEQESAFGCMRVMPTILPAAAAIAQGDHGGLYETSYLLAMHPALVDMQKLQQDNLPWFCTQPDDRSSDATAELGERMFQAAVNAWEAELRAWMGH
jgi:creatinine amidohydrolase